ncbi:MAG: TetR family transcriptional regulator [Nocardiaceae bacterium]|nr:TetR family transcriptional regulator [Nocardiaceae bacterium]
MSRTYAGQSALVRADERRSRFLDAGFDLVGTGGVAALGVRSVCREAGLSLKFFYESFPDVDALLFAVYDHTFRRFEQAVAPAMLTGGLPGALDAAALIMEQDPRICRTLLVEPVANSRLRQHVRSTIPEHIVAILGPAVVGESDDPRTRTRFSALFGAFISLFIEWTEGNLGDDRELFVRRATAVASVLLALDPDQP